MGALLTIRDLRHRRGGRDVLAIDALRIGAGERLAVLGANGAGKTTLLRLLAGLETPAAGSVEIDGAPPSGPGVRRRIGYATQRPGLLSTSVKRNVELPLRWRGIGRREREATALNALGRLNAAHLADRKALALSGGEAQRVSLARALALAPSVLLLDEPAAGLDPEAREAFLDDLDDALAGRATTVVHVSHRAEEALRIADRVAVLAEGRVRQLEEPSALLRAPADATVARLVGYDNVIPVEIRSDGQVLVGGRVCGLSSELPPGGATLAAWATAIRIGGPGEASLPGTVERVSAGQGRWEIEIGIAPSPAEPAPRRVCPEGSPCSAHTTAGARLRAQLGLDAEHPAVGAAVGLRIDRARSVLLPR